MAAVSRYLLASSLRIFIVSLVLHLLLDSNHPFIVSVAGAEAPNPSPISIAFETDGSIFDEGYVTPANIVNGAYRTDLIVSTASADTIVIVTNDKTCAKPNVTTALSCFPETLGMSVVGMDMTVPQGPVFEWNEDSLGLYARGNSANSSIQFSNPGSLEPSMKVDSLQLYYTSPAESNINYGLLGLGKQSTILRYLTSKRLITSNAYGLYLGAELKSIGPKGYKYSTPNMSFPGSLVLGGYDKRQFGGQILGGKLSDTNFPRLEISDIALHNDYQTGVWPQSTETITVDVDSTTPDFHLPETIVTRFANDIGAKLDRGIYGYDTWGSRYVGNVTMKVRVPSSMTLDSPSIDGAVQELAITIPGSEFYQLRPTDYVANKTAATLKPKYYLPVRPTTKRLVVGRAFLRSLYLVVDYDKGEFYLGPPAWGGQGAQDLVPIVSSWYTTKTGGGGGKPKSKVGIIVGGVLGGIAAVLILAGIVYWLRRRGSAQDDSAVAYDPQYQQYGQQGGVPPALPGYSEVKGNSPVVAPDRGELEA